MQRRCQELHLDLVETDFAVLLEGCQHGATWGQVSALLQDMTRELTALQPSTIAAAEAFFRSASSLFARASPCLSRWQCTHCHRQVACTIWTYESCQPKLRAF